MPAMSILRRRQAPGSGIPRTRRSRPGELVVAGFCLLGAVVVGVLIYLKHLEASFPSGCVAGGPGDSSIGDRSERLQAVLDEASRARGDVGMQATIIDPGGTTWTSASGRAHQGQRCPVTADNLFYVGSLTKMYTAALIMSLVDDRRLALDEPAAQWLDAIRREDSITLRQLLSHTSGLPNYTDQPAFVVRYLLQPWRRWQPADLLAYAADQPLKFPPGSQHEYSNSNYVALGLISEAVSGRSYGELLQERLLRPLSLHHTYFLMPGGPAAPVVHGYDEDLLHLGRRDVTALRTSLVSGAYSAGGLLATSAEVARFTYALFAGQITSRESLSEMTTFVEAGDPDIPEQTGYGLGVRRLVVEGRELWGHTGTIPGYSAISLFSPQDGYVITVLTNLSVTDRIAIVGALQSELASNVPGQ